MLTGACIIGIGVGTGTDHGGGILALKSRKISSGVGSAAARRCRSNISCHADAPGPGGLLSGSKTAHPGGLLSGSKTAHKSSTVGAANTPDPRGDPASGGEMLLLSIALPELPLPPPLYTLPPPTP